MEGQGTEINIYRMINKVNQLRDEKEKQNLLQTIWILFLDFAKAYDVVNHNLLFEKMRSLGIQKKTI